MAPFYHYDGSRTHRLIQSTHHPGNNIINYLKNSFNQSYRFEFEIEDMKETNRFACFLLGPRVEKLLRELIFP